MLGLDCMQKTLMTREQQLYQEATIGVPKKKAMTARTKSNLSFVKQNRPELFKAQGGQVQEDAPLPSGFKPLQDGWLHNPDTGVFLEPGGQKLWFDPEAREYQELYEGSTLPLCVHGGATSSSSRAKHVFIPDLHRTAQVLKADLGHLDRPAALLALLDPSAVAQAPHDRLIRRLAAARSEWSEEAISSALAGVLSSCEATGIALALVVGQRAFAAAKGASCWCFAEPEDPESASNAKPTEQSSKVLCHDYEKSGAAFLVLVMGELGLKDAEIREAVLPHLHQGRPRAASVSLRQMVSPECVQSVGCMRLAAISATSVPGQPPSKRQRVVGVDAREVPGRVRIRQILLRAWRGGATPKPEDPVRRKQIQRTGEEAEGQLLQVLDELRQSKDGAGLSKSFTLLCRSSSECQSSLQGGELAGDLGWLDKDKGVDSQRANGKMVRPAVPAPVLRAAFDLEVGEMSDLVSSEVGVHLLLRSA